jgi:hypothetical protein
VLLSTYFSDNNIHFHLDVKLYSSDVGSVTVRVHNSLALVSLSAQTIPLFFLIPYGIVVYFYSLVSDGPSF